jgi:hypothetical protein
MIQHAQAVNAGLLKNFPKGYTLGDEHAPHISVTGGYFYTAYLDELFAAASGHDFRGCGETLFCIRARL